MNQQPRPSTRAEPLPYDAAQDAVELAREATELSAFLDRMELVARSGAFLTQTDRLWAPKEAE